MKLPTLTDLPDTEARTQALKNLETYRRRGVKVRSGWTSRAPEMFVVKLSHGSYYTTGPCDLTDHPYRLSYPDGTTVFVAEPYYVDEELLAEFRERCGHEWEVTLGDLPLHFPGRTKPLLYTRRAT